jgi:hypothetical protein
MPEMPPFVQPWKILLSYVLIHALGFYGYMSLAVWIFVTSDSHGVWICLMLATLEFGQVEENTPMEFGYVTY